jgi:hypothetical protein
MSEDTPSLDRISRIGPAAALIGIIGLILVAVGYFSHDTEIMHSYLFGFVFWGSITIGCFGLMMLQGAIRSAWGTSVLRIMEAGGGPAMILLLAVLFLPILLCLNQIYPWMDAGFVHGDSILEKKQFYLNPTFFVIRTAVVLLLWFLWSGLMKRSTRRQDESLSQKEWDLRSNWGAPGLVMFFVTVTFIATDWAMSIEPRYYSTVYGLIFAVGTGLSAMSLAVLIVLSNADRAPYNAIVSAKLTKDLGNLLFTLTMLWGYLTLSQFLITWQGNLPLEVPYYMRRTGAAIGSADNHLDWNLLSGILILFQFFIPFFALLAPRTKRWARNLIWVAGVIFVVRIVNVYWLIFPAYASRPTLGASLTHWTDWAAFFGIGGIWVALFVSQLKQSPLLPRYDTRLMEAEHA